MSPKNVIIVQKDRRSLANSMVVFPSKSELGKCLKIRKTVYIHRSRFYPTIPTRGTWHRQTLLSRATKDRQVRETAVGYWKKQFEIAQAITVNCNGPQYGIYTQKMPISLQGSRARATNGRMTTGAWHNLNTAGQYTRGYRLDYKLEGLRYMKNRRVEWTRMKLRNDL